MTVSAGDIAKGHELLTSSPVSALEYAEALLERAPNDWRVRLLRVAVLDRVGRYDEAISECQSVMAEHPNLTVGWLLLGNLSRTVGARATSVSAYREAIRLKPTFGEAWWSLANLKASQFDDRDVATMESALHSNAASQEDRLHLHFALGDALEARSEFERAWRHFEAGNRIRRAGTDYSAEQTRRFVDRSIGMFDAGFFADRSGAGNPAADPLLIVGLPRAGSTLVEQILASHSEVEGTSELPDLMTIARSFDSAAQKRQADVYPLPLRDITKDELRRLGDRYLESTRIQRKTDRPYFIDKMPNNWIHVGLIRLILPNAKIIDARRNPLDCGFSNFKQHFARGQNFSYDLADIGRYYQDYVRFMDHFDQVQPGKIHRVIHEKLVNDPETEVRALLAYCGLEFEESCLRFYENKRAVHTVSSEQVRQPLTKSGFDRWKPYEQWLGPLKEALGPALHDWDAAPRP